MSETTTTTARLHHDRARRSRSPRHTIGPMTVELKATIRQRPPDHRGGYELETAKISAEGNSYEQAKQLLEDEVPDGWQMLSIGRY